MEVNEYKELKNNEALILSVINHGYQKEILNKLCKIENDIYIQTPVEDTVIIQGNTFVLSVDKALKLGHKIFLFDEKNIYTAIYKAIFDLYNVDIEIITNESELVYDPRESLVVINIYESLKRCEFRSILMDKGYELSNFGYTSLFDVTESDEVIMGKTMPVNDALTGVSIMHKNEKIIGWKQLKSKTGYTECKIIILGNSTSQYGLYPFKSWPELLIEKFDDSNMKVTMYVGATSSDDIVSEYLRLVRDYWVIRPDIVISFSGLTNLYDENLLRQFNVSTFWINNSGAFGSGIRTEENHYEFWMRITSMMKQFVEYNGARFLSFLQPMCCFMPEMSLHEKMQFDLSKKAVGAKCFYDNMNEVDDVYFNLLDLFFHKEGMFIDLSHYSETANLIISDIVYKKLIEVKT